MTTNETDAVKAASRLLVAADLSKVPKRDDLETLIQDLPSEVRDAAVYEVVMEAWKIFRAFDDEIVGYFKDLKADANKLHKGLCAAEREQREKPQRGINLCRTLAGDYDNWLEEEAKRAKAEADAKRREIEAEYEAEADRLEGEGKVDLAAGVRAMTPPPPPVVEKEAPRVAGVSTTKKWDFSFIDPTKLKLKTIRAAMRETPPEKLKSSWLGQYLRRMVKAHGDNVGAVIGEGAVEPRQVASRRFR